MKFIKQRDKMKCIYCGVEVLENVSNNNPQQLTIDHINPFGETATTNLVLCCRKCNPSKGDKNVISWCEEQNIPVPEIVFKLLEIQQINLGNFTKIV